MEPSLASHQDWALAGLYPDHSSESVASGGLVFSGQPETGRGSEMFLWGISLSQIKVGTLLESYYLLS